VLISLGNWKIAVTRCGSNETTPKKSRKNRE
jgi:hypothetical protein